MQVLWRHLTCSSCFPRAAQLCAQGGGGNSAAPLGWGVRPRWRDFVAEKDIVFDRVRWHTQTPGNAETKEQIDTRFRIVFDFLERNGLLLPDAPRPTSTGPLSDELSLCSSHLTEIGLKVMKAAYDRWIRALDRGTSPEKSLILERALRKIINETA